MQNLKSRNWNLILYPKEDDSHYKALQYIINNYSEYAYIEHDRDINSNGELKKSHTHITIRFHNARYQSSIALELGIPANYMQKCNDFESSLKYLIHYGDTEKFQYSIDDIYGTLKDKLINILDSIDLNENDKLLEIVRYISQYNSYLSISQFITYICNTPLLSTYRKFSFSIHQMINEHNVYYTSYNKKNHD